MSDPYTDLFKPQDPNAASLLGGQMAISDATLRQTERLKSENKPGFMQGLEAASRLESTGIAAYEITQESGFVPDPNDVFPATDSQEFKDLTKDIPVEFWDNFARGVSKEHRQFIRERTLSELEAAKDLAEMGGMGTAIHMGRAMLDEGAIALTYATGGLAAPLVLGQKLSRLQRMARLGALSAAENTALDAILLKGQETKDSSDLFYSALGGFALGGLVGGMSRAEQRGLNKAINEAADAHDLQLLNEAGIYGAGKPPKSKIAQAITDIHGERENLAADAEPYTPPMGESRSVGAAQVGESSIIRPLRDEQAPPEVLNTPRLPATNRAIRFDLSASLAGSENPWTRWLGGKTVADPVGYRGQVNEIAAEEVATFLRQRTAAEFSRESTPALHDWLAANKVPMSERTGMTARFFEAVTDAVRRQDFSDPHVARAARGWASAVRTVAEEAKRAGVKGFEDLELRSDYVPRLFSGEKIKLMVERYGTPQIERLIMRGIVRGTDLPEELAQKIAKGYLHRVRKVQAGLDTAPQFALRDKDLLRQSMLDAGIPDKQIDEVIDNVDFGTDVSKEGKMARAKRRLTMDEDTLVTLKDREGNLREVALTDLFENDARLLLHNYSRQVSGHTAFAKTLGIKSRGEWESALRKLVAYEADNLNRSKEALQADLNRLDFVYKAVTGQPVEEFTNLHKTARVIRDINFMRTLNQAGFAQAADLGNVVSSAGWRTMIEHMPALKGMINRIRATGKLEDPLAAELEAVIPLGTDGLRHATPSRFDSGFTDELEPALTSALGVKADVALHSMRKATGYISGLTPMTIIQQRMAARAIAQNMVNTAFDAGGKKISANRLKAMGLSDDMAERVFTQIREHTATETGALTGKKLKLLNMEKWDDLDARDAFEMAVYRQGRRLVQENDLGSSAVWMHRELGRVLIQFRSFMINAYSKQLLHNFTVDGWKAFGPWSYGMVFGGLAYTLRQLANTTGAKDQSKQLRERLSPEHIAAGAFNTAGMSSLIPPAADSVWQLTGNQPIFQHSRTTGLGTSLLDWKSNPTTATVGTVLNVPGMFKHGVTRGEARQMLGLLPYQNALGVKNLLDKMVEDMPERASRD